MKYLDWFMNETAGTELTQEALSSTSPHNSLGTIIGHKLAYLCINIMHLTCVRAAHELTSKNKDRMPATRR